MSIARRKDFPACCPFFFLAAACPSWKAVMAALICGSGFSAAKRNARMKPSKIFTVEISPLKSCLASFGPSLQLSPCFPAGFFRKADELPSPVLTADKPYRDCRVRFGTPALPAGRVPDPRMAWAARPACNFSLALSTNAGTERRILAEAIPQTSVRLLRLSQLRICHAEQVGRFCIRQSAALRLC